MKTSRAIFLILFSYATCSFLEWFIHSKVMHGNPKKLTKFPVIGPFLSKTAKSHLDHHKEVLMDMTLDTKHPNMNELTFRWETTLLLFVLYFGLTYPVYRNMKINTKQCFIISASVALFYTFVWNNIHVDMHKVTDQINITHGVPNCPKMLSKGPVYNYLFKYHAIHHFQKGSSKGNYNIVLPGCDYIMNTHNGFRFNNVEYCKKNYDKRCFVCMSGSL